MKKLLSFLAFSLGLSACAQTNLSSVMTDSNGIVQRPRNFWANLAATDPNFSNAINGLIPISSANQSYIFTASVGVVVNAITNGNTITYTFSAPTLLATNGNGQFLTGVNAATAITAGTATNLNNKYVQIGPGSANNGISITDADGSALGITGGGIDMIVSPSSYVSPIVVNDINNNAVWRMDTNGNVVGGSFVGNVNGSNLTAGSVADGALASTFLKTVPAGTTNWVLGPSATNVLGTAAWQAISAFDVSGAAVAATNGWPWSFLYEPTNANLVLFAKLTTNAYDASGAGTAAALAATNGLGSAAFQAGSSFQATNNNLTLFAKLTTNAYDASGAGTAAALAATNGLGSSAFVATSAFDVSGAAVAATNGWLWSFLYEPTNVNLVLFAKLTTNAYDASGAGTAAALAATNSLGTAAWSNGATAFDIVGVAKAATNGLGQAAFVNGSSFQTTNNNLTLFAKLTTNAYAAALVNPFTGIVSNWYNFPQSSNRLYFASGIVTNITKP